MRAFLIGLFTGVLLLPLCALLYIRQGYAPVATASPALPFEHRITSMALNARVAKEAPSSSPVALTDENLVAGAQVYREYCAVCHGLRGMARSVIAKGMFPSPPLLLHGKGVTDDPPGETYWKVQNGIRLTGMPAFTGSLTDGEMWQVTLLLANAGKLPPAATTALDALK